MQRILIIDDEPMILETLQEILRAPDREFVAVSSGEEALRVVPAQAQVDIALIDKNLPGLSGIATTRLLRRLLPDLEVILLTGFASLDSAIEAIKVGAFDYFTKPVTDVSGLKLKVQNAIEKTRLRREQRRLIEQLRESEQRYRSVFEAGSDGIIICDAATGCIESANLAAKRLYGYSAEEFRQLTRGQLDADSAFARGSAGTTELRTHRRKQGTLFQAEVAESRFVVGERTLLILSVRDVSERLRAEQERREIEDYLRQAQKMEAIGRLAGGIAHDFNNVLTIIISYADFLRTTLAEDQRSELDAILQAADRGAALTRQLLTFSRRRPPRPQVVDVNQVVREMEGMLRRTIGETIELVTVLASEAWLTKVDADQLGHALINLVVNARDAMPQGGRVIIETQNLILDSYEAQWQAQLEPGEYICLAVSDTGVGMSREVLDRVFEPFFTTKEPGKGTGLGLATVYGIAQQAGGSVRVYSEVGHGSIFRIYLPRTGDTRAEQPLRVRSESPKGRGETILVAEDDDIVRSLICRILTENGYQIIEGRHGEEALAASFVHEGPIDLLLTDMVMPRMLGRELATALVTERPEIRVLFMSGYSEHAIEPSESELVGYLQKPFTERELLVQVRELLDLEVD